MPFIVGDEIWNPVETNMYYSICKKQIIQCIAKNNALPSRW